MRERDAPASRGQMDALVPTPPTPPEEPERNLWDRQPGETGRQFEVFQQYLGLGPRRSCNTLAKDIGISRQLVYRWSGRNNWVLRAQAYERFLEQDAVNEVIVRRRRP